MNSNPITNAYGCGLTPQHLFAAMLFSGLEWHIPPAQYLAIQTLEYYNAKLVEMKVVEGTTNIKMESYPSFLLGLPFVLNDTVPETTIELRLNGDIIHKIQTLAIPALATARK